MGTFQRASDSTTGSNVKGVRKELTHKMSFLLDIDDWCELKSAIATLTVDKERQPKYFASNHNFPLWHKRIPPIVPCISGLHH